MPVAAQFVLDRDRFSQALQDAHAVAEIRAGRRRPLNAAVAAFFMSAVDARAITGAPGIRPEVYPVGPEDLIVAVRAVGHRARLDARKHQAASIPFNVNEVLSVMARGFTAACHVVDRLLQRADDLTPSFRAIQRRARPMRAPHLALLMTTDEDGRETGEIAIPFPGGRTLRTNAGVDGGVWIGADHLRVCEPDGREVGLWERIEWEQDPIVIAAVLATALGVPGLEERSIARDPLSAVTIVDWDLGTEVAIPFPGGRTLHTDARALGRGEPCGNYLRVCDPDGTQLGFWAHPAWRQQPAATIGAVIGCALGVDLDAQSS